MIWPLQALGKWWRARQRKADLEFLWPACVAEAHDLEHAKAAFMLHAVNDPAWRDLSRDELTAFVDQLVFDKSSDLSTGIKR